MRAAEELRPGSLWSLWDMLEFGCGQFYDVTCELRDLRHLIKAGTEFSNPEDAPNPDELHDMLCRIVGDGLRRLKEQLRIIGCNVTISAVDGYLGLLGPGISLTREGLVSALDDVDSQLRRESSAITLFALSYIEKELFRPSTPLFGQDVANKFGSVEYEIEEAGKCLAFGRSTASAFHSLRTLEAGIRALTRCLGIPDPTKGVDRTWGKVLRSVKDEIDRRWPPSLVRSGDAKLCEQAYATLSAMNPYRNDTMHLDQKYTEQEAKDILAIVGAFMRKLASRMDDNGFPQA
jgi:hypothetical protein